MEESTENNSNNPIKGVQPEQQQNQQNQQNQLKRRWFPLESNPVLINEYCTKLGFPTSTTYEFVDVFSTEEWALDMIVQPVQAVLLLYPLTEKQLEYKDPMESIIVVGQDDDNDNNANTTYNKDSIWFIKQRIGNACGTIGILHALLNIPDHVSLIQSSSSSSSSDSWLYRFSIDTPYSMDPIRKAIRLENDPMIASLHDDATSSVHNQTNRGTEDSNNNDDIITHFITFVQSRTDPTIVYELDGRKSGPIRHCCTTTTTSTSSLLHNACAIIRDQFMKRDPDELRFTILALAPTTAR